MEDNTANLSEPMAPEASNQLDMRGNEGVAPQHKEQEAPEQDAPKEEVKSKPESRQDAIKRAMDDVEAKNAEPKKEEPKVAVKPAEESAPVKSEEDKNEPVASANAKPSEGRRIIEAPARFLPRAKELWNNVPHPVREEFERISKENEAEISQYREAKQEWDNLKEYNELGKQHGVSLKQALDNYVGIERKFSEDPASGFRQLFSNLNMQPQQAISHILRAFNVTPQALAQHIASNPNEYTALARPVAPVQQPQVAQQAPSISPQDVERIVQSRLDNQQMVNDIHNQVIVPFAQEYPEYYQHQKQVEKVLQSGIIEQIHGTGLSPRDKLEVAFLMVAPHASKASVNPVPQVTTPEPTPAVELRGNPNKSVKGSPNPGLDNTGRKSSKLSRSDAIHAAMAELGIR